MLEQVMMELVQEIKSLKESVDQLKETFKVQSVEVTPIKVTTDLPVEEKKEKKKKTETVIEEKIPSSVKTPLIDVTDTHSLNDLLGEEDQYPQTRMDFIAWAKEKQELVIEKTNLTLSQLISNVCKELNLPVLAEDISIDELKQVCIAIERKIQ